MKIKCMNIVKAPMCVEGGEGLSQSKAFGRWRWINVNPELNDLALYKIRDNYKDNYTKPSHSARGSQLA